MEVTQGKWPEVQKVVDRAKWPELKKFTKHNLFGLCEVVYLPTNRDGKFVLLAYDYKDLYLEMKGQEMVPLDLDELRFKFKIYEKNYFPLYIKEKEYVKFKQELLSVMGK